MKSSSLPPGPFVKICGVTRSADARHAVEHGATALGFIFWRSSPRFIEPEQAGAIIAELPAGVLAVGVFVNEPVDTVRAVVAASGISVVQLHGSESPADAEALGWPVLRAVGVDEGDMDADQWPDHATLLLDALDPVCRGGTGVRVDWIRAAQLAKARRLVLAGGLTPDNVAEAVDAVRPFGVDVSSGVEAAPGIKDPDRVAQFLERARIALAKARDAKDRTA